MTATSEFLRSMIRTDRVEHTPECRYGWPDIYHPPECGWQRAIEEIYRLEREDDWKSSTRNDRPIKTNS